MIVAERKPFAEIKAMIDGYEKILLVGCGTCVAVCMAGGEKEVGILGEQLKMAFRLENRDLVIDEVTLQRQCDREFLETLSNRVDDYDVLVSMACGAGVQYLSEIYSHKPVFPAINTSFIGVTERQGIWSERCAGCGNCVLDKTGGLCPIARCSKSLLNGPCGGSVNGKCEINPDIDCVWQLIYDKLKKLNQLDKLEEILPVKDWSTSGHGGTRKIVREDLTL
jgi:ferredoxin